MHENQEEKTSENQYVAKISLKVEKFNYHDAKQFGRNTCLAIPALPHFNDNSDNVYYSRGLQTTVAAVYSLLGLLMRFKSNITDLGHELQTLVNL